MSEIVSVVPARRSMSYRALSGARTAGMLNQTQFLYRDYPDLEAGLALKGVHTIDRACEVQPSDHLRSALRTSRESRRLSGGTAMASVTGDYSRLYSTVCTESDRRAGDFRSRGDSIISGGSDAPLEPESFSSRRSARRGPLGRRRVELAALSVDPRRSRLVGGDRRCHYHHAGHSCEGVET